MKYQEIIDEVKELYPSEYSDSQYEKWILELENNIAIEKGSGVKKTIDLGQEVTVGVPFDRMYIDFLMAQVCLHQHDDEGYTRYMNVFKSRYSDWQAFNIRTQVGARHRFKNWI